jgi:hypothetical protein
VGLIFTFGIYPLAIIWPSGWSSHTSGHSDYLQMILGTYATLGVFLMIASRNPLAHRSLIWFTVWSSIVHGAITAVQSVTNPEHIGHLLGDVASLFVVAAALAILTPRDSVLKAAIAERTTKTRRRARWPKQTANGATLPCSNLSFHRTEAPPAPSNTQVYGLIVFDLSPISHLCSQRNSLLTSN